MSHGRRKSAVAQSSSRPAKEAIAEMMVDGVAVNAVTAMAFSKFPFGDVDAEECMATLCDSVRRVQQGDLAGIEALLMAQAVTLNTLFAHLAHLATTTEFIEKFDRYLRLALKAQGQCRATCETLATIKNPPTVFTRQANIAQGPQQVNNTVSVSTGEGRPLARAGEPPSVRNKLLEVQGERVDSGTTFPAGGRDPAVAAVGPLNGSAHA